MSRPRITPADIIDVDALPEWDHSQCPRTVVQHAAPMVASRRTRGAMATIDLTEMDDSDSDISILLSTPKPGTGGGTPGPSSKGKGKETDFPSTIVDKFRKRGRHTPNSSQTPVPSAKKLKRSSPSPTLREQLTSSASGSTSDNNEAPSLSLSELSSILSRGNLSQDQLAQLTQTMLSHLHPSPAAIRKDKMKRTIACIELSSDGEEVLSLKKRRKRMATSSSHEPIAGPSTGQDLDMDYYPDVDVDVESDEESKYDYFHAGYDIHDPDIWTPMSVNLNRLQDEEDEEVDNMPTSKLEPAKHVPRYVHPDVSRWYPSTTAFPPIFIWDRLRLARNLHYPTRPRPTALQPLTKPITRPWDLDFNLHRLKAVNSFKESPGSINRIEQKGGWTVVASACTGGLPDTVDEQLSPYNRPGSLITWRNRLHIPEGHQIKKGDDTKHYAVHDLKFFPNKTSFVSTGADGTIRLWNLSMDGGDNDDQYDTWCNKRLRTFNASPHDLAFKPDTSILAVAEKKIHIFTFRDNGFEISADFLFYPSRLAHVIGSLAWGSESTKDQLFGSSEPCLSSIFDGIHKALDVTTKKSLYQFDASEAGDMLSLDLTGATLALATRASENKHLLRIYDTRRKLPKATHLMELEPFPIRDDFEGEVNCSSFSPDGMYLALARNDNCTHVYDRRMWDRGVIFEYRHGGESKAASQKDVYGVVKAQWVQSQATRRMALVTGGEDGCIRMWDPTKAAQNPENGKVLGETNSDIGYFSLGDPYAGENQLVVGDNTGEVTIFNNVVI